MQGYRVTVPDRHGAGLILKEFRFKVTRRFGLCQGKPDGLPLCDYC